MLNAFKIQSFFKTDNFSNIVFLIFPICVILGSAAINFYFILCSLIYLIIYIRKKEKNNNINQGLIKIITIIFFYLCIISIFSDSKFDAFKSAFSQFRFLFFLLFLSLISEKKLLIKKYLNFSIILILIVCFDALYQFKNGTNLLGYSLDPKNPNRLGGVFDQELILGSFIFLTCIPVISILLNNFKSYSLYKKFFTIFFIICCFTTILLSGERMSFLLFFLTLSILLLFYFNFKKVLISLTILTSLLMIIIVFNDSTRQRVTQFYNEISLMKNQNHIRLFSSAVNIWEESPLIGVGLKNYRIKCNTNDYDELLKKNRLCSTHPHNFYFEILTETGIIGFMLFLTFFSYLLRQIFINYKKINTDLKPLYLGSALIIFTYIFPLKSSGSFFSTFTASFFWFNLGIIYFSILKLQNK